MSNQEQKQLEMKVAEIDRRRAQLEMVLNALRPDTQHCCRDRRREEIEVELSNLWRHRIEIAEDISLRPSR
jgi:hypothetical protein